MEKEKHSEHIDRFAEVNQLIRVEHREADQKFHESKNNYVKIHAFEGEKEPFRRRRS